MEQTQQPSPKKVIYSRAKPHVSLPDAVETDMEIELSGNKLEDNKDEEAKLIDWFAKDKEVPKEKTKEKLEDDKEEEEEAEFVEEIPKEKVVKAKLSDGYIGKNANIKRTMDQYLLDAQTGKHTPMRWLKLTVRLPHQAEWIGLLFRGDNLYVPAFFNKHGHFQISEPADDTTTKPPETKTDAETENRVYYLDEEKYTILDTSWNLNYASFLGLQKQPTDGSREAKKLAQAQRQVELRDEMVALIGQENFIADAVKSLSDLDPIKKKEGIIEGRKKLGGLIFLLCEFLRMRLDLDDPDLIVKVHGYVTNCKVLRSFIMRGFQPWSDDECVIESENLTKKQADEINAVKKSAGLLRFILSPKIGGALPKKTGKHGKGKGDGSSTSQVCSATHRHQGPEQVIAATARWTPPPPGWIKVNTDASFIGSDHPGGAGAIARDSEGRVIIASCSPVTCCADAEDAEARAALRGVKMIQGMGFSKVILELDCAGVIAALRSQEIDISKQWPLYDETKNLLKTLDDFQVCHTKRESNRSADALAKLARSAGSCIWTSQLPDFIADIVNQDSPVTSMPECS